MVFPRLNLYTINSLNLYDGLDIIVDLKSNNRISTNEATAISFRQANLFQQRCAFY